MRYFDISLQMNWSHRKWKRSSRPDRIDVESWHLAIIAALPARV
jgi:hypothetical protein